MTNTFPANFDWQQYKSLHYYEIGETTEAGIKQHYLSHGKRLGWPHNFSQVKVLVYSGGKTGSSTLLESFKRFQPNDSKSHVFHLHNDDWLEKFHTCDVINAPRDHKLLLVSSYREPITRHISSFFQNLEIHIKKPLAEILKMDIKTIIEKFFEILKGCQFEAYHPHLENSQKNFDNVNIFNKPFNRARGFQVWETPKVKILMLRFDKINQWDKIIKSQTTYTNFRLLPANLTSDKLSYKLYQKFLEEIVFPKKMLDEIFEKDHKNLEYFYNWDEITKLKQKWYNRCRLNITKILYGISPQKSINITGSILNYFANQSMGLGMIETSMNINELIGRDPYPNERKKLMIWIDRAPELLNPSVIIDEFDKQLSSNFANYF